MTNFNSYLTKKLNSSQKWPVWMAISNVNDTMRYRGLSYDNYINNTNNAINWLYCIFVKNSHYDNHFTHIFLFHQMDSSINTGKIRDTLTCLPYDATKGEFRIMRFGSNYTVGADIVFTINILDKRINVRFPTTSTANSTSYYHLGFDINAYQINFDEYITKFSDTQLFYMNPFMYDIQDYINSHFWNSAYYAFDYSTAVPEDNVNASVINNNDW